MPTVLRTRAGLAALLVLAAGCTGGNTFVTPPSEALELDVVRFLGEEVAASVALTVQGDEETTRPRADPTAPLVAPPAQAAASCTYNPASVRWTCSGVSAGASIGGTATLTFRNAAGQARPVYDAATTASVDIVGEISGTANATPGFSTVLETDWELELSNLAGDEAFRLWNGDGATTQTALVGGGARKYSITAVDSVYDLRYDLPHDANRFPDAGSIVVRMNARLTEENGQSVSSSIGRRFVVTFDGDETATITVGTRTYTLNLLTRVVSG